MASSAKHRAPRTLSITPREVGVRIAPMSVAAAAAVAGIGLSAAPANAWDPSVWDRVAACESGGNWSINTGNGFYGGLQFTYSTWKGFGGQAYASYAHQATKSQQIAIARRTLYSQGPGAWPVCSVRAGLTRTNGGADPNALPGGGSTAPAPAPAPAPPSSGTVVTRYVSAGSAAYVRSGPGSGYRVVDTLARGTKVSGRLSNGWLRIGDGRYVGAGVLSTSAPQTGRQTSASRSTVRPTALLVVDGVRGPLTTRAIQAWVGTTRDGVLGPVTTKALQRKVGTTADGVWGARSQAALQDYLGISRDGSSRMNWRTVVALQKFLNRSVIG